MKKLLALSLAMVLLVGCNGGKKDTTSTSSTTDTNQTNQSSSEFSDPTNPVATITMENGGVIEIELYPKIAPNTVANFVTLAQAGFYNGLIFHRIIPGFMIQGGDPDGNGMGGPDYAIAGEFSKNGFKANTLKHTQGVISMARSTDPNSAGSQFFIMTAQASHLDGDYAGFGKVIKGLDVVSAIEKTPTDANDKPEAANKQVMKTVTVDTKGKTYELQKYGV